MQGRVTRVILCIHIGLATHKMSDAAASMSLSALDTLANNHDDSPRRPAARAALRRLRSLISARLLSCPAPRPSTWCAKRETAAAMKAAMALARSPDAEPHLYLHPKVSMNVFISLSEDVNAASKASGPAGHAQTGGKSFLNTWASERP